MTCLRSVSAALTLLFTSSPAAFAQCVNPTAGTIVRGTGAGSSSAVLTVSADSITKPHESRATAGADFVLPSGVPEVQVSASLETLSGKAEVWVTALPGLARAKVNATLTVTRGETTVCAKTLDLDKRVYVSGYKGRNLSSVGNVTVTCRGNLDPDDQTTSIRADLVLFSEAKARGLGGFGARARYSADVSFSMRSCFPDDGTSGQD